MKLTIIGASGSFPGPGSPASCYLVTADDGERTWRIVLDLGNGAASGGQTIYRSTDGDGTDEPYYPSR